MMCSVLHSYPWASYLKYPCYATEAIFYTGVTISIITIAAACLTDHKGNLTFEKTCNCKVSAVKIASAIKTPILVVTLIGVYAILVKVLNKF